MPLSNTAQSGLGWAQFSEGWEGAGWGMGCIFGRICSVLQKLQIFKGI